MRYEIRECTEPDCCFRFPTAEGQIAGDRCPWCGGRTLVVHRLAAAAEHATGNDHSPIVADFAFAALIDNVRSTFNVGSIFRSADGAGLGHLYLCGVTPTPGHRKLAKTALGAEQNVAWSHHRNAVTLARSLYTAGHTLWALETTSAATPIFDVESPPLPFVLVVGSEVIGVDPDLLALCEHCVSIPMTGLKQSLNVATAFGVAAVILRHRYASARRARPQPSA